MYPKETAAMMTREGAALEEQRKDSNPTVQKTEKKAQLKVL